MNYHDFMLDHPDEFEEALKELDWGKITTYMDSIHPLNDNMEVNIADHIKNEMDYFITELTPPPNPDDEYDPETDGRRSPEDERVDKTVIL